MSRPRLVLIVSLLGVSLASSGCAALMKGLGLKTDLKDKDVADIQGALANNAQALCPGDQVPLVLTAKLKDGKILVTEGAGHGKVTWDSFAFTAEGASVSAEGVLTIDSDPRRTLGHSAHLHVAVVGPPVTTEMEIPIRYDCAFSANFGGANGRGGEDGQPGHAGVGGQDEVSTGDQARPGGNGGSGGRGQSGQNGESGLRGDDVLVSVTLWAGADRPLLQVRVHSTTQDHDAYFVVDPQGGSLRVSAAGGRGGHGGSGGRGGDGGSAGTGSPPGSPGEGGDGGDGADGADGGDGGRISVAVSREARPYLKAISFDNSGGAGGEPGVAGGHGYGGSSNNGQGPSGRDGRPGRRTGRDGHSGPRAEISVAAVGPLF